MKNLTKITCILLSIICFNNIVFAQTFNIGTCGFTGRGTISSSQPELVRPNTKMVSVGDYTFYIGATTSKIFVFSYNTNNLKWTSIATSIFNSNTDGVVKTGTSIVVTPALDVYYVSNDNLIHKLSYASNAWTHSIPAPSQMLVSTARSEIAFKNGDVFYVGIVGSTFRICALSNGGLPLVANTIDPRQSTNIRASDIHVYFVGTNNKIYDLVKNNGLWQYSISPLGGINAESVAFGSQIIEDNNYLYYQGATNNLIYQIFWVTQQFNWLCQLVPSNPVQAFPVRTGTDIVSDQGRLFYVTSSHKIRCLEWNGLTPPWSDLDLYTNIAQAENVKPNTQLLVWNNPILEEGSTSYFFHSTHVFYIGSAENMINYFILDDQICAYSPPECHDTDDVNQNGTGWDDTTFVGLHYWGSECNDCKINGGFPKKWYNSKLPMVSSKKVSTTNSFLCNRASDVLFVGVNNKSQTMSRQFINSQSNSNGSPSWQDEFNNFNSTTWRKDFHWGNHGLNDTLCQLYWNEASNVTTIGGALKIEAKIHSGGWYPDITHPLRNYVYGTGMATTEHDGGSSGTDKRFYNSLIESRMKLPRGSSLWPSFWFSADENGTYADINIECEPNGKVFIATSHHGSNLWQPPVTYYAVGYRMYDNYYTYGIRYPAQANIGIYFNNENIGTLTNWHTIALPVMYTNAVVAPSGRCDVPINSTTDNYFLIDYIREYSLIPVSVRNYEPSFLNKSNNSLFDIKSVITYNSKSSVNINFETYSEMFDNVSLSIVDQLGRVVATRFFNGNALNFDINELGSGIFYLIIRNANTGSVFETKKFILLN